MQKIRAETILVQEKEMSFYLLAAMWLGHHQHIKM